MGHSSGLNTGRSITVLAVSSSPEELTALQSIFSRSNWTLNCVSSIKEGCSWMAREPVPVVICARELPDGNWESFLRKARRLPRPPRVLVASTLPDDQFWEDVGNADGYDILIIPFRDRDVFYSVHMAWQSWHRDRGLGWTNAVEQMAGGDSNLPPAA